MERNVNIIHADGSLTRIEYRPSGDVVFSYINPGRKLRKK